MGVIIFTARTGIDNKIQGFSAGADYYFSKPVDSRELSAAITNLMCRLAPECREDTAADTDAWIFRENGWYLTSPKGIEIRLTAKEGEFIRLLLNTENDCLEKEKVLHAMGYLIEGPYGNRALGVMVTRLRKKIKTRAGDNALIKTVHGFGFSLGEKLHRA